MPDRRRQAHARRLRELAAREAVDAVRQEHGLFGAVLAAETLGLVDSDPRKTEPPEPMPEWWDEDSEPPPPAGG